MANVFPANLDEYEQQMETAQESEAPQLVLLLPTLAEAQRALARVRYFRQKGAEVDAVFASEIARLEGELARVKAEREEALKPWQRRESWYLFALEQYVREQNTADPKLKTIKLPAGDLSLRAQQPEWSYGDEKALGRWLQTNAPQFVKVEPAPIKTELKKSVEIRTDGTVILKESGEIIPGVTVTERPPKFEVKV